MATSKTPRNTASQPSTRGARNEQTATHEPPIYNPIAGKEELGGLADELAAIPEGEVVTIRVDVEAATYAALGVAGFVASPWVAARFARLPAEELDPKVVTGLGSACFATLYALAEARAAGALETEAKIPAETIAEASAVEGRMQALCEYHLGEDPEIKPELDRLRPGAGHRDLANDLLGYARICELRADVVKADQRHYRAGDAARARELAGVMIQAFSAAMTPKARAAHDLYARAWTLLQRRYDEVRAAGLWLFRADPARDERFPSLFAAARPNVGRPRKVAAPATSGDQGSGSGGTPAVE